MNRVPRQTRPTHTPARVPPPVRGTGTHRRGPAVLWTVLFWAACLPWQVGALTGDLNGDQDLNVADMVRITEMIEGNIPVDLAADLDGDGTVTDYDAFLLSEAIAGVPIPTPLAHVAIGPEGGRLQGGEFSLTVPPGALAETVMLSLASRNDTLLADRGLAAVTGVYVVHGLPAGTQGVQIRLTLPAGRANAADLSLALGEYVMPFNASAPDWHFRLVDEGVVDAGQLSWTPPAWKQGRGTWNSWGVHTWESASGNYAVVERIEPVYSTARFRIRLLQQTSVTPAEVAQIEELGERFEAAPAVVERCGFTTSEDWFPIEVHVRPAATTATSSNGEFVPHLIYGGIGHIELDYGLLATPDGKRVTSVHEYFHYVQTSATGLNLQSTWVAEAASTWIERLVSTDPSYVPSVFFQNKLRAPLEGLHQGVNWTYGREASAKRAQNHGYVVSVLFEEACGPMAQPNSFWAGVFTRMGRGAYALDALRESYTDVYSGDFALTYRAFLEKYFMGQVAYMVNGGTSPLELYSESTATSKDDFKANGAIVKLTKQEELNKLYEHEFQVQDMGAATARFEFGGKVTFPPETVMHIEAEGDDCDWLFAVRYGGSRTVPVRYNNNVYDAEKQIRSLDVPIETVAGASRFMMGVVMVNERTDAPPHTSRRPITLRVSFELPPYFDPGTVTWTIDGKAFMQATVAGLLKAPPGTLGLFTVGNPETWRSASNVFTGMRTAVGPELKPLPQTVTLYADIDQIDCGSISVWNDTYQMHAIPSDVALVAAVADGVEQPAKYVSIEALRHPDDGGTGVTVTIPAGVKDYAVTLFALATESREGDGNSVQAGQGDTQWQLPLFSVLFFPLPSPAGAP